MHLGNYAICTCPIYHRISRAILLKIRSRYDICTQMCERYELFTFAAYNGASVNKEMVDINYQGRSGILLRSLPGLLVYF